MSRFYATIQGSRGPASRCGDKSSGISSHTRGWNIGCLVTCHYDKDNDCDVIKVYRTGGSNGYGNDILITTLTDRKGDDKLL